MMLLFVSFAFLGWGIACILWWRHITHTPSRTEEVRESVQKPVDWCQLIDCIPAYVILLDEMGAVIQVNAEADRQFGDRLGVVLRHPGVRSLLDATLKDSEHGAVFSTSVTLDVPVSWTVHIALRYVVGVPSAAKRVLMVLSDRSEAQAVDKMRVDFVSHASHELRTPLASICGFIDVLRHEERGDDRRHTALAIMAQQAERMKRLIDRLLYLSRVQARTFQRPQDVHSVDDIIAQVMDEILPRFEGTRDALHVDISEELLIQADEDEMVQLLLNLIENALKYARKGRDPLKITVFARSVSHDDVFWPGEEGILLGVEDNGGGIASHHVPRLTERFYRVDEETGSQQREGSGLGLAIVKHIVERHGGQFQIKSDVGQGTVCLVKMPSVVV